MPVTGTGTGSHSWDADIVAESAIQLVARMLDSEAAVTSRADRITRQLERAIVVGVFAEGDRLPPEQVLAEALGVSSITLRQSLAELRAKGYLETRRGRGGGSFVSAGRGGSRARLLQGLAERSTGELRELGDFAASIGEGAARRAATRADEDDLAQIRRASAEFERSIGPEALRRADSRFHLALSVAAHSTRLANATLQVHGELAALTWLQEDTAAAQERSAQEHAAIVRAVADRDADLAGARTREHYERQSIESIEWLLEATIGGVEHGD